MLQSLYKFALIVSLCHVSSYQARTRPDSEINVADNNGYAIRREKRAMPSVIGQLLKGAKLLSKEGNYRMFGKSGGYSRAEAEFDLLRPKKIVDKGNTRYGQVDDVTVVLIKRRRGGMINLWKNQKRSDGSIELQKIDRIKYTIPNLKHYD